MTYVSLDHRRVQTAVIGDKYSGDPVILPMDHHELDRWRKLHPDYTYWCGIQLGGCGGELSDRRYTDKVCHFAHHPNAVCHRTANGESSADHLFIKRGMERLLARQGLRGKVSTRDLGSGPGDAVDVFVPAVRRRVRFQLGALDYLAWRRAADEFAEDAAGADWVFAQDGPLTHELQYRQGYSLRVRLSTHGGERRVHIGVSAQGHPLQWTPLEECTLTPTGLLTPPLETVRLSQARHRAASFPVQGGLVFAPVPGSEVAEETPFDLGERHLIAAYVKPVDSPVVRALVSLPSDAGAPLAGHVYRVPDGARVLVADEDTAWVVTAERYIRLNAHEAQRTGLWSPSPAPTADCGRTALRPGGRIDLTTAASADDSSGSTAKAGTAADSEAQTGFAKRQTENRERRDRARDLISQLRPLEGALGEAVRKQVTRAINGAELWLAAVTNPRGDASNEGGRHVRQLELALRAARRDLKLDEHSTYSGTSAQAAQRKG
ncbi:hypothetical protein DIZ27_40355 [Streptomyces sp. NWU339]|uniref:hypothetical protein n=1 Tax=Streptomyces sp. NWU339 TaxID=2185284 RepID=UPI000D67580E|nr:hypothetical protein [Streptomyces sp. NWU339]PWI05264.1 hypothetical protein DIZ27_40355 [Streptomyces sp. NWU339]